MREAMERAESLWVEAGRLRRLLRHWHDRAEQAEAEAALLRSEAKDAHDALDRVEAERDTAVSLARLQRDFAQSERDTAQSWVKEYKRRWLAERDAHAALRGAVEALHPKVECSCDYADAREAEHLCCAECGLHWPCDTGALLADAAPETPDPTAEDYVRATAVAVGLDPDLAVAKWRETAVPETPAPTEERAEADDDMCPNCVTPWKCNGPHGGQR